MNEHQEFEREFWGTCANTFAEEAKQITYAHRMGLVNRQDMTYGYWPQYDAQNQSILDIGGGPVSMLLKTINRTRSTVVDPCPYPQWVKDRYVAAGISYIQQPAETYITKQKYDECWIYNVLQHVEEPQQVLKAARFCARTVRIFEWVDLAPTLGHPHELHAGELDDWMQTTTIGTVEHIDENGAYGSAYFGVFHETDSVLRPVPPDR